jgi:hypothetical protein
MKYFVILINILTVFTLKYKVNGQGIACGVPNQEFGLIVGGETAKKGDFPW